MTSQTSRHGTALALAAMLSVQLGAAIAVHLIGDLGPAGVAWLRLAWASLLMLVIVRPRAATFTRKTLVIAVGLGVATAGFTLLFMAAIARIPLGTASALEFLGPLTVAVAKGSGRGRLLLPGLAAAGVVLLTSPWSGAVNLTGVLFALGSAGCLVAYILLTQRLTDELDGIAGLAVSIPVAGLIATVVAGPQVLAHLTPRLLLIGLGLAILLPVIPLIFELQALRRITASSFGTLLSLEPAIAMVLGIAILDQVPAWTSLAGLVLVVAAGIGAARAGTRPATPSEPVPVLC